jgi:hypothetical protein
VTISRVLNELKDQQLPPMELSVVSQDTRTFVLIIHSNDTGFLVTLPQITEELAAPATDSAVDGSSVDRGTGSDYMDSPLPARTRHYESHINDVSSQEREMLRVQSGIKRLLESGDNMIHHGAGSDYMDSPLPARTHYETHIKDMSSQERGMLRVQSVMKRIVESMDSMAQVISKNRNQLLEMKELVYESAPSEREKGEARSNKQEKDRNILDRQQQILQAQQREIDRLVTEQETVQDATTLAFATLEYPFPRFFVVLPVATATMSSNRNYQTLAPTFRLFFLCESGHPSTPGESASPNIHLARHEGYEVRNSREFLRNYTPYLISMTYILKNGTTSHGFNIPSLSHLTLADGIDEVQSVLDLENNTIQSLISETMLYISNRGYDASMTRGVNSENALDMIESTDPRSIVVCLADCTGNVSTAEALNRIIPCFQSFCMITHNKLYCYRNIA